MGFEIVILAAIIAMRLFPESPLAKLLHLHLVVRPMNWFSKLERHHLLYAALLIGMLFAAGEIIAVLGSADVALALAWDVSIYLDAVAVAAAVAVARQARVAIQLVRSKSSSIVTRPAARRSGRERRDRASSTPPANDKDAAAPELVLAFILIANEVQLTGLDLMRETPMLERFLAAVRDPDFRRLQLADRAGQLVPVGMVGDHQRKLDVRLPGTLADSHPA